jgi:hypothetical protein
MRASLLALTLVARLVESAFAQEDKKTDDLKPSDPDTGESTVQESTLGLLPNLLDKNGIKFAVTYIGEVLGNPSGGAKQSPNRAALVILLSLSPSPLDRQSRQSASILVRPATTQLPER